eukprot:Lankesteria_metandrocarpae@DN2832_c0_g1_i1.p1
MGASYQQSHICMQHSKLLYPIRRKVQVFSGTRCLSHTAAAGSVARITTGWFSQLVPHHRFNRQSTLTRAHVSGGTCLALLPRELSSRSFNYVPPRNTASIVAADTRTATHTGIHDASTATQQRLQQQQAIDDDSLSLNNSKLQTVSNNDEAYLSAQSVNGTTATPCGDDILEILLNDVASLNTAVATLTSDIKLLSRRGKLLRIYGSLCKLVALVTITVTAGVALRWSDVKELARTSILSAFDNPDLHEAVSNVLQKTASETLEHKELLKVATEKMESILSTAATQLMSRPVFADKCAAQGAQILHSICSKDTCQNCVQDLIFSILKDDGTKTAFADWMRTVMNTEEARNALREYATTSVIEDETCQKDFTDLLLSSTREVMQSAEFQKDAQAVLWEAVKAAVVPWSSRSQNVAVRNNTDP